jgi:hypothetical protein
MRYSLVFSIAILLFTSCNKDKFTTVPQIEYKKLSHNAVDLLPTSAVPVITIHITDAEGDIGFTAKDTAFIYMKNLLTNKFDSVPFPDLQGATKNNFKADIDITISKALDCRPIPGGGLHTDTLYFEIYVKDFAKNKSNVISTPDPVYFICR